MAEEVKDVGKVSNPEEEEEKGDETKTLTPWEQHGGVISIPRFDYNAPSSLLQHSHSGFLITCTIKREKSATKEAMSILGKYLAFSKDEHFEGLKTCDSNADAKRQKLCIEETGGSSDNGSARKFSSEEAGDYPRNAVPESQEKDTATEKKCDVSLVKLTKSGLLLLIFRALNSPEPAEIVSNVLQSLASRDIKAPLWCHRILPVQATCTLTQKELQGTVSKLVRLFVNDDKNKLSKPLKFAAGYNRRGLEETQGKVSKCASDNSEQCALLDRNRCFETIAAGVKDIVLDSIVDLETPELCVLVELLPLSRMPNGSFVAAVSILPQALVNTKPRLCIKPLVSESKTKKR